jgi:hypothetical protein
MDRLAGQLSRDFEAFMDADLSVGEAFQSILRNLEDIKRLSDHYPLSCGQAQDLVKRLEKIDAVLGFLH